MGSDVESAPTPSDRRGGPRAVVARLAQGYRMAMIRGRWIVVGGWIVIAVVLSVFLPAAPNAGGGVNNIGGLLPAGSKAVEVELKALSQFRVPVLSETSVVVQDPNGLSVLTRADVALWALSFVQASQNRTEPPGIGEIIAAIPIPTANPTIAVTYLYTSYGTSLAQTTDLAQGYASHFHNQPGIRTYVTGLAPAQLRQGYYLQTWLLVFEIATLALITIVVAIAFRSFVAPFAVLFVAGLGYLIAVRLLGLTASALGFALPDQLKPLIAALLIGVVTDYCVLFFFGLRNELRRGPGGHQAASRAIKTEAPIVAVAGLTVAGGTAALLVASFELFRAFGPALCLTVLVGLAVSVTMVPALMAILGRRLFLPSHERGLPEAALQRSRKSGGRLIRIVSSRRGALIATLLCVAALGLAAVPLTRLAVDLSFTSGLPSDDPVQRGAQVLDSSGIRGVTAPTEVIIEGTDIAKQRPALNRLQASIGSQPGVAAVLGPAQNPLPDNYGIVFSRDGNAARFVVIFDSDPLGAFAIDDLATLNARLHVLVGAAGVTDATVETTGQTSIAAELGVITRDNLYLTLLAALAVELVILIVYLRALLAPLVLLACSALGVAAALGLTVLVFQGWRNDPGLTFYSPFATAVLLLALGSDYNVFTVGSIWDRARDHPLSRAIALAMPAAARAIGTAGVILASTFALVAIIPLETFRQIAFTMTTGLLIDTFLIRPILTPAVLTLLGRFAGWPSKRIRTSAVGVAELADAVSAAVASSSGMTGSTDGDEEPAGSRPGQPVGSVR